MPPDGKARPHFVGWEDNLPAARGASGEFSTLSVDRAPRRHLIVDQ